MQRPWAAPPPGRLVGRGHPAGDFLEAWAWEVLDEAPGYLRVEATLPDLVVTRQARDLRPGKVLVDWSQNNPAKTTIVTW